MKTVGQPLEIGGVIGGDITQLIADHAAQLGARAAIG